MTMSIKLKAWKVLRPRKIHKKMKQILKVQKMKLLKVWKVKKKLEQLKLLKQLQKKLIKAPSKKQQQKLKSR